jgi:hypothetical protein
MRIGFDDRFVRKNSRPDPLDARESPGTDSLFFDRFRPLGTLARGKLCKIFSLCTQVRGARDRDEIRRAWTHFCVVFALRVRNADAQEILISS